jgi:hypothetical protein
VVVFQHIAQAQELRQRPKKFNIVIKTYPNPNNNPKDIKV